LLENNRVLAERDSSNLDHLVIHESSR